MANKLLGLKSSNMFNKQISSTNKIPFAFYGTSLDYQQYMMGNQIYMYLFDYNKVCTFSMQF